VADWGGFLEVGRKTLRTKLHQGQREATGETRSQGAGSRYDGDGRAGGLTHSSQL
jgi:hypothetical protein